MAHWLASVVQHPMHSGICCNELTQLFYPCCSALMQQQRQCSGSVLHVQGRDAKIRLLQADTASRGEDASFSSSAASSSADVSAQSIPAKLRSSLNPRLSETLHSSLNPRLSETLHSPLSHAQSAAPNGLGSHLHLDYCLMCQAQAGAQVGPGHADCYTNWAPGLADCCTHASCTSHMAHLQ